MMMQSVIRLGFIKATGICVILCVVAIIGVLIFEISPFSSTNTVKHPSDVQLTDNFIRNESDFERLIKMARMDTKLIRIADTFTWLDDNATWPRPETELGFSMERWNEYKLLFTKLRLRGGLLQYPSTGVIYLIASNQGLLTGGSNKGYVYSAEKLSPVVDTLDALDEEDTHAKPVYKNLKGNWYLYFESNR